jgi:hypothetical protein
MIPQFVLDNPDFLKWYLSKSKEIQEIINKYPPGYYTTKDIPIPHSLLGYDEDLETGKVLARLAIDVELHDLILSRRFDELVGEDE